MDLSFLNKFPRFNYFSKENSGPLPSLTASISDAPRHRGFFDVTSWGYSLLSFAPWVISARDIFRVPVFNRRRLQQHELQKRSQQQQPYTVRSRDPGCGSCTVPRFRPYVAKVPWHNGARGFLSQLFPRYGHYCGPNWSSGKAEGSMLWDQRPLDWLDFCCYCHDIGYDSHDQANLLKADLAFLECLERPKMITKGDIQVANLYRTMCVTGLRNILIPYRRSLVRLLEVQSLTSEWVGSLIRNTTCKEIKNPAN